MNHVVAIADMVMLLQERSRSAGEIARLTEAPVDTVRSWLAKLQDGGRIRPVGVDPRIGPGPKSLLWELIKKENDDEY